VYAVLQIAYLDNAATTPLCDSAKQKMTESFDLFGNPSSLHKLGTVSLQKLEESRKIIADILKAEKQEIIFTSGGTESDNIAILGAAQALCRRGNKIVTTAVEHSAVIQTMKHLDMQGYEVVYIKPNRYGEITPEQFESVIDRNTILVSCMHINNEVGAVYPVEKIREIIDKAKSPALFHVDAVQSFGKYPICPHKIGADLMSLSSHKIHGPKGAGGLYIRRGARIVSPIFGGGQEGGIRPGTEALYAIIGFAAAAGEIGDFENREKNAIEIKNFLIENLKKIPDIKINSSESSSAYVLNFSVMGIRSETMLHFLEAKDVYVSSGSACAKGAPSHVLSAMGLSRKEADSAIRVSLSRYNTVEDAVRLIDGINEAAKTLIRAK
jgi:cysteine desulfurase